MIEEVDGWQNGRYHSKSLYDGDSEKGRNHKSVPLGYLLTLGSRVDPGLRQRYAAKGKRLEGHEVSLPNYLVQHVPQT